MARRTRRAIISDAPLSEDRNGSLFRASQMAAVGLLMVHRLPHSTTLRPRAATSCPTGTQGATIFFPLNIWPVVHQDILKQCAEIDGVADGILESPDLCNYNPSNLICIWGQNLPCLTTAQANTIGDIHSPLHAVDGSLVYLHLQAGADAPKRFSRTSTGSASVQQISSHMGPSTTQSGIPSASSQ
jgi:hypothetical protein